MKKAFELSLKTGIIPVLCLPHISEQIVQKVKLSKKFKDYTDKLDVLEPGVQVSKIQLLSIQMFGERVGFINLRAHTSKDGLNVPSYVFLRGASVAVLVLVNGRVLVVQQYRVPVQKTIVQAPAGMLDQSGDLAGTAATQIQEETSIKISHDNLKPLGSMYPSPGGCDEELQLFSCEITLPEAQLQQITEKIHGKEGEAERIKVKLIDYEPKAILDTKDAKLICLMYAHKASLAKM